MTSVMKLGNQSPVVVDRTFKNVKQLTFKNDDNSKYVRNNNQSRPTILMPQADSYNQIIENQRKAEKKQKLKQNLTWGVSLASGLAIIFMVLMSIRTNRLQNKELAKVLGEQTGEQKTIPNRFYESFKKLKDKAEIVSVKEKSTDPLFADQVLQIKRSLATPAWLRKWTGVKEEARFYYIYGPSGVGKSYGMEQMAKEIGANYRRIQFSEFGSEYQNKSARNITEFFENLVAMCKEYSNEMFILNIDEADALFVKVGSHNPEEALKFRSAFINAIDKAQSEAKNLIVGCTTNYAPNHSLIDAASLRRVPGRIEFSLPKSPQIEALIDIYTRGSDVVKNTDFMQTNAKEIEALAKSLEDGQYGHSEIMSMVKKALEKYHDDCLKEIVEREGKGESNIVDVKTIFDMKYFNEAREAMGEAVAKKNTYNPVSELPI